MTKLRVNTATLKTKAKNINLASREIYRVKSTLSIKGASARTYDQNSFGPRVRAICQQAARHADDRADVLNVLSSQLSLHAKLYDNADNKFLKKLLSKLILLFTSKTNNELDDIASLSNLAKKKSSNDSKNKPIKTKTDEETTTSKNINFSKIANSVPITPSKGNKYKREGYSENGSPASNCVFYAWEAVYLARGVKLPFTGNASNWKDQAITNGYKVDTNPQAGNVIWFNFNHVGFIESVEVKNGRTYVTWSEEQAIGGRPEQDWGNVTQVDGMLRWQVTADLTNYFNNNKAKVIHIN